MAVAKSVKPTCKPIRPSPANTLPDCKSANTSPLNVLNVVNPPKKPVMINPWGDHAKVWLGHVQFGKCHQRHANKQSAQHVRNERA